MPAEKKPVEEKKAAAEKALSSRSSSKFTLTSESPARQ
ncbi:hypothetical protein SOVF_070360 [Spinacia oleracea]|nr:hypothetical protein SOVF_070360 [Spinacia oleracea]